MKFLPKQPNLEYLRREARALKSSHRNRDQSICQIIGHFDISLHNLSPIELFEHRFSILDAQRVVARQYGFASWRRIKNFVDQCAKHHTINTPLRNDLLTIEDQINSFTSDVKKGGFKDHHKPIQQKLTEGATRLLNPVFDQYGWPGPDMVGKDGVDACFMLVGHAVTNSTLNWRACDLLKESLPAGSAFGYHYANLLDRSLTLSGKPSVYGTSAGVDEKGRVLFSTDINDPDNLDKRRATVGFDSFENQRQEVLQLAQKQGEDLFLGWEKFETYKNDLAREGGYI